AGAEVTVTGPDGSGYEESCTTEAVDFGPPFGVWGLCCVEVPRTLYGEFTVDISHPDYVSQETTFTRLASDQCADRRVAFQLLHAWPGSVVLTDPQLGPVTLTRTSASPAFSATYEGTGSIYLDDAVKGCSAHPPFWTYGGTVAVSFVYRPCG